MRVWDIAPSRLCRKHLLGEHVEIHAIWNVIARDLEGYARHPETMRWRGKLAALHARHDAVVAEMTRRGFRHASPLDRALARGALVQDELVTPLAEQRRLLRSKGCDCRV